MKNGSGEGSYTVPPRVAFGPDVRDWKIGQAAFPEVEPL